MNLELLATNIENWSTELGFSQVGICDVDLSKHEEPLKKWLEKNYHGDMGYMERHGLMRARPSELVPGSIRAISVRLDYLPTKAQFAKTLKAKDHAYISRYALGRDYHKLMRKRLQKLGDKISEHCAEFNFRALVDSAPILERPLAEKAGLGWVGKHSLLINKEAGSWFFIGELLVDIPLPLTEPSPSASSKAASTTLSTGLSTTNDCGNCVACLKICPTQAIIEPYVVDARRCISYFTIESSAAIPLELRPMMGNRIYGCDDCQLICPWNKYAKLSMENDFQQRNNLDQITLLELFQWSEEHFLSTLEGSPIRRIGFQSWQRNISVALGNAPYDKNIVQALKDKLSYSSDLVTEHIEWALEQQDNKKEHLVAKFVDNSSEKLNLKLIRSVEVSMPRDA
jgi:epoxyqueuosine reductase